MLLGHIVPWILHATVLLQYMMKWQERQLQAVSASTGLEHKPASNCLHEKNVSMLLWECAHRHRPVSTPKLDVTEKISQVDVTWMAGIGVLSDI